MAMQKLRIDACMVNPGFIKPTALVDGGKVGARRRRVGCGLVEPRWLSAGAGDLSVAERDHHAHRRPLR